MSRAAETLMEGGRYFAARDAALDFTVQQCWQSDVTKRFAPVVKLRYGALSKVP